MNEHKFTPGPWEAGQGHPTVIYWKCVPIAYACDGKHRDWVAANPLGEERAKANARLIAAAPELLEALESIENDSGHIPPAVWEMRNAAIAKATGKGA